jgi:hypothetical protein
MMINWENNNPIQIWKRKKLIMIKLKNNNPHRIINFINDESE